MNTGFDKFHICSTYGAFGHVGKERYEIVLSASFDEKQESWLEYDFKCKPTRLNKRPCIYFGLYHYRLDWHIWFAGFQPHNVNNHKWINTLVDKLLTITCFDYMLNYLMSLHAKINEKKRKKFKEF